MLNNVLAPLSSCEVCFLGLIFNSVLTLYLVVEFQDLRLIMFLPFI